MSVLHPPMPCDDDDLIMIEHYCILGLVMSTFHGLFHFILTTAHVFFIPISYIWDLRSQED